MTNLVLVVLSEPIHMKILKKFTISFRQVDDGPPAKPGAMLAILNQSNNQASGRL